MERLHVRSLLFATIACAVFAGACRDRTTGAGEASTASGKSAKVGCDFTVVPGDHIATSTGEKKLPGATAVKLEVEVGKTYCVFGGSLSSTSTLRDGQAIAPANCKTKIHIGGSHIDCEKLGVALSFVGPMLRFASVTVNQL
ncbi:MAG: hypothetical protein HYY84_12190 [Deltaproteobacteria bacterium]|nr:hypothetical protein [Deltaproteobacteria bacterium]